MKEMILKKIEEMGYEQNGPIVETTERILGIDFKKVFTIAIDWEKIEMYKVEAYKDIETGEIEICILKI